MTRDEAIKIHRTYDSISSPREMEDNITLWAALGMLKLDEPKSATQAEEEIMHLLLNACRGVPYLATCINETLAKAGLKIVEK